MVVIYIENICRSKHQVTRPNKHIRGGRMCFVNVVDDVNDFNLHMINTEDEFLQYRSTKHR